jgi:hypothetical protein
MGYSRRPTTQVRLRKPRHAFWHGWRCTAIRQLSSYLNCVTGWNTRVADKTADDSRRSSLVPTSLPLPFPPLPFSVIAFLLLKITLLLHSHPSLSKWDYWTSDLSSFQYFRLYGTPMHKPQWWWKGVPWTGSYSFTEHSCQRFYYEYLSQFAEIALKWRATTCGIFPVPHQVSNNTSFQTA